MKPRHLLLPVLLAVISPLLHAGESKRTAEYLLATPSDFEGKEVNLDVSFVQPVHWKSPVPELAFFRAMTIDRQDRKFGGHILVAIAAADAGKFAKKYGMDFEGRGESNSLRGTFLSAPARAQGRDRIWIVDTTGLVADLVKSRNLQIEEDPDNMKGGEGFREGNGQGGARPPRRPGGPQQ